MAFLDLFFQNHLLCLVVAKQAILGARNLVSTVNIAWFIRLHYSMGCELHYFSDADFHDEIQHVLWKNPLLYCNLGSEGEMLSNEEKNQRCALSTYDKLCSPANFDQDINNAAPLNVWTTYSSLVVTLCCASWSFMSQIFKSDRHVLFLVNSSHH